MSQHRDRLDTTERTGYEWLARFMDAQAILEANTLFVTFKLGQIGAVAAHDRQMADAMLEDLKVDRADIMSAAQGIDTVLAGLIANIESAIRQS